MTDAVDDYPQIAVRRSKWFYIFSAFTCCIVLSHMTSRLVEVLVADERVLAQDIRILVWPLAFVLCGAAAAYLLSRMDFDKAVLSISYEGVSAPGMIRGVLPWTSIASVRVETTGPRGLFKQVALVLHANENKHPTEAQQTDRLELVFQTSHLRKISADHLASTLKRYKGAFDKTTASGQSEPDERIISSSAWTGLTED